MKTIALAGIACILVPQGARAAETALAAATENQADTILVTASRTEKFAGTKTETPLIETPQPITIVTAETYLSQGAINISDTVRYAAGITANPYGRDTRVDGFVIRGIDALQFRDGMRDIFSYYATIPSDPYNFSRVEIVRGPASVLFGQGSIGGLVNLVSKTPDFETTGEISAVYGSNDRKELLGDANIALSDTFAVRGVARVRDADTYVDHVPDDRVMLAPSIRWQPARDTDITLLGLYQEDDGGSTAQFLPVVGTKLPNGTNPPLDRFLFVGSPGWDRYAGRSLQGGGSLTQRFGDDIKLSLKARYIDSDLTYYTHYTNSYGNPTNPYLDTARRQIGLYSDASQARMNIFSTDNNAQVRFDTGANIEHLVLAGLDYSWNDVKKRGAFETSTIDLYAIDYSSIPTPEPTGPFLRETKQKQLGFYLQDQIRVWDRVSIVLGARRDRVSTTDFAGNGIVNKATTFRAGIIGEIGAGFSPFFSYTESFLPISGVTSQGTPFRPQAGRQYETGVKWQPDPGTLVTATAFHIKESGRPIADPRNPLGQIQAGELTTKGFELEASHTLPGDFELLVNYGYNKLGAAEGVAFDYLPRHNASIWSTKTIALHADLTLRAGAGVRYTGKRLSTGGAWSLVTKANTLVDALAEINWRQWRLSVNATNLFGDTFYASCLARGDCFIGAPRNVMASIGYRF